MDRNMMKVGDQIDKVGGVDSGRNLCKHHAFSQCEESGLRIAFEYDQRRVICQSWTDLLVLYMQLSVTGSTAATSEGVARIQTPFLGCQCALRSPSPSLGM